MATFVLRIWLPDRPGALGQVASRVGAVKADVVGIEILERGAGRAIDELLVEVDDPTLIDLLVAEVSQVDGVAIEEIRPAPDGAHDPGTIALELVADLAATNDPTARFGRLCEGLASLLHADWVVAVHDEEGLLAAAGEPPPESWILAFLAGSRHLDGEDFDDISPPDVMWARAGKGVAVAAGRHGRPLRARERRQLALVARITGSAPVVGRPRRAAHG